MLASLVPFTDREALAASQELVCSFCNRSQDEVKKLIAGPSVYICNECVDLCGDICADEVQEVPEEGTEDGSEE